MGIYEELKNVWKLLGLKGHVKNFSSKPVWVLETDSGPAIAHTLKPMFKSPPNIDADAFKRADGKSIDGHKDWWKIYDSNAELFDRGKDIRVSIIAKSAVGDDEFTKGFGTVKYNKA